jgi:hypothetical protein
MDDQVSASRDDKEVKDEKELVRLWLDALALADKEERKWREGSADTVKIYRNTRRTVETKSIADNDRTFNILHSNIETILPAIYNSTPIPDVRRRFGDDDKTGKEVADLIERALSFSVDSYDFDEGMKHDIKDMELTGRGLSRVRYLPYLTENQEAPDEGVQESGKELNESLTYEEVACEHVPWKHFRRGPARIWADVPWIAFELFLTREELTKLSPKDGPQINLDTTLEGADDKRDGENVKDVFKRARVWEIWDKESRKVLFIAEAFKDRPIKTADDPLELMGFFPVPRPLYAIETSDTLVPVIPYEIYKDQAEELERVSRRIMALVESIKSKGIYDGSMEEIDQLSEADDNEMIPVKNVARYADGSGIEKGISWWPIEPAVKALEQLVLHREAIKATIYEITGISDILRGNTDAQETATAQNIKQQWGSLRIQNKQVNIQRYARDLFRLKAEIIANKFQWQTITLMTGLDYPPQEQKQQAQQMVQQAQQQAQPGQPAPQIPDNIKAMLEKPSQEEIEQLLRNDATRNFRVDVESDSTIRADMTRNQQNMTLFLQGTAEFAQAMGPIIMTFKEMTPAVLEVYSAFARNFKLGKQAEDALDSVADKARQAAQNPQPQQEDPSVQAEKVKAQAVMQKAELDMKTAQQKHQMEMEKMQAELQIKKEELHLKQQELQMKAEAFRWICKRSSRKRPWKPRRCRTRLRWKSGRWRCRPRPASASTSLAWKRPRPSTRWAWRHWPPRPQRRNRQPGSRKATERGREHDCQALPT